MQSMLESIRDPIQRLAVALAFAPKEVASGLILALAALIALAVHWIGVRLLRPLLSGRHPYWGALLHATNGPTRLALLVLALAIALPGASFDHAISDLLTEILSIATIVLIGWIAMTAGHLAGDLYIARARAEGVDIMLARRHVTQVRILRQVVDTVIVVLTVSAALMTFEPVRQYGVSLFASAGVAGLVAGLAARPMLSNLIAGLQIATTQPIRLEDEVVVENQWGRVQEINSTYVVLGLWDLRQMIVPLSYFIEKPFENWTRDSTALVGSVLFHLGYKVPIEALRAKVIEIVKASPYWDGDIVKLQVQDAKESSLELRVIASARTSGEVAELRYLIREKVIEFLQREYPACLPPLALSTPAPPGEPTAGADAPPLPAPPV
ncbi:MAG TPA: mechanosensitive ion channel domain-containing protein [Xanthobacteraceae bacterium]|nr:mechanosensitive ion channel domain-containing protein [Xanthobacteraceae bacterium]